MKKHCNLCFGAGSVDITPPMGAHLAGYFTGRRAEGVHDKLFAKLLFLRLGGEGVMLIACDLVGVPASFSGPLRELVSERAGLPARSVMVSATHTHTGPVMTGPLADEKYLKRIREDIVAAAGRIVSSAEEGRLEFGSAPLSGYAFNRRYFMRDGTVLTNPGKANPDVLGPAGPVDESVNVMVVKNAGGGVGALLVNTGLHPDTVSGSRISADWPGYLSEKAAEELGGGAIVLFLNGTQGDINHFDVPGGRVEQGIEEARRIGRAYGEKVLEICRSARPVEVDGIGSSSAAVDIPRRRITGEELKRARSVLDEYGKEYDMEKSGKILESQDIARGVPEVKVYFAKSALSFHEKYRGTSAAVEIAALRIGAIALVGVGGELFTGIGMKIKEQSPFEHTLISALSNGYNGYLATAGAFAEGGYETMPRETSQFGPEAEGAVIEASLEMLARLAQPLGGGIS